MHHLPDVPPKIEKVKVHHLPDVPEDDDALFWGDVSSFEGMQPCELRILRNVSPESCLPLLVVFVVHNTDADRLMLVFTASHQSNTCHSQLVIDTGHSGG